MTPEQVTAFLKELVDMGLMNANKYVGYVMRRFDLSFATATQVAGDMLKDPYYLSAVERDRKRRERKQRAHRNRD